MRSRKQSAASSEPPEQIVFFLDESLGSLQVAQAFRQLGEHVEIHRDHFPAGCEDRIWLEHVGRKGWVVLTKDDRIRYREAEKQILLKSGVRAFVLTGGNLTGAEMAEAYRLAIGRMRRILQRASGALVATVTRTGRVTIVADRRIAPDR